MKPIKFISYLFFVTSISILFSTSCKKPCGSNDVVYNVSGIDLSLNEITNLGADYVVGTTLYGSDSVKYDEWYLNLNVPLSETTVAFNFLQFNTLYAGVECSDYQPYPIAPLKDLEITSDLSFTYLDVNAQLVTINPGESLNALFDVIYIRKDTEITVREDLNYFLNLNPVYSSSMQFLMKTPPAYDNVLNINLRYTTTDNREFMDVTNNLVILP